MSRTKPTTRSAAVAQASFPDLRYDGEGDRLRWLRKIPLFPTVKSFLAAECLPDRSDLDPGFLRHVSEAVEASDLALVLKRLGIQTSPAPIVLSPPSVGVNKPFFQIEATARRTV
jgi:hypothetical protein